MTCGSHDHPDKYLGDASRTVRRHLADCPRGGCYRSLVVTTCAMLVLKIDSKLNLTFDYLSKQV